MLYVCIYTNKKVEKTGNKKQETLTAMESLQSDTIFTGLYYMEILFIKELDVKSDKQKL